MKRSWVQVPVHTIISLLQTFFCFGAPKLAHDVGALRTRLVWHVSKGTAGERDLKQRTDAILQHLRHKLTCTNNVTVCLISPYVITSPHYHLIILLHPLLSGWVPCASCHISPQSYISLSSPPPSRSLCVCGVWHVCGLYQVPKHSIIIGLAVKWSPTHFVIIGLGCVTTPKGLLTIGFGYVMVPKQSLNIDSSCEVVPKHSIMIHCGCVVVSEHLRSVWVCNCALFLVH